ncbi:uncharacterized protein PSFLO_06131 [Pseudozyma flocculosa]|uniref:Uncharacterized protein n=1 Tax=Pseudozyma flocculosa TaxID=84751 RepID=A0A5C3FBC7_9BASI|nr:uncharacterized protein PSFLO_06131 [Pseudozyma flocculosa]
MAFASRLAELSTAKIKERRARVAEQIKASTNQYVIALESAIEEHEEALEESYRRFKQEESSRNESIAEDWQAIGEIYGQLQRGHKKLCEYIRPIQDEALAKVEHSLQGIEHHCETEVEIIDQCEGYANGNGAGSSDQGSERGQRKSPKSGNGNNGDGSEGSGGGSSKNGKRKA